MEKWADRIRDLIAINGPMSSSKVHSLLKAKYDRREKVICVRSVRKYMNTMSNQGTIVYLHGMKRWYINPPVPEDFQIKESKPKCTKCETPVFWILISFLAVTITAAIISYFYT